jgi:hypothetical protein
LGDRRNCAGWALALAEFSAHRVYDFMSVPANLRDVVLMAEPADIVPTDD